MESIIKGLLTSPDYRSRVKIPNVILQGDTDIVTSTSMVCTLVKNSNNPNLKCEIIEYSGHIPGKEGMNRLFEELFLLELSPIEHDKLV